MTDAPCSHFICAEDLPVSGECLSLLTDSQIESAIEEATYLIYRMSGRRVYGLCDETVRPTIPSCSGGCGRGISAIRLGEPPERILWVRLDGETVPASGYRLERSEWKLWLVDREWPHCQDLTKPLTEVGTFGIRYRFGRPIDLVTKRATIDLTMELVKLLVPGQRPKLPAGTTSVSRRGIALSAQSRAKIIEESGSYLESVNQFQALHNPSNEPPTFVYSPEIDPGLHNFGPLG